MPFQFDQSGDLIGILTRLVPIGSILTYAGVAAPGGYLVCDGSIVAQASYPGLYAIIGSTWNTGGEGAGNFRLPNCLSRSPMFAGPGGGGLSARSVGQLLGEENHVLTVAELAVHTHVQNAHLHTVNDPSHNHVQNAHNHIQDQHNHTQNAHTHTITDPGHFHNMTTSDSAGAVNSAVLRSFNPLATLPTASATTGITINNATATNVATTATNQSTTASNISNTTGITVDPQTAVNQNAGLDTGHNTIHPVFVALAIIKY